MELISKKALLDSFGEPHPMDYNAVATIKMIKDAPTIDAVPLDKLCEWLPNAVQSCPANPEGHNEKCEHMKCEECWKEAICNWMEEEKDGTDNP